MNYLIGVLIHLLVQNPFLGGSAWFRFANLTLPGVWGYLGEWVLTLFAVFISLGIPFNRHPGFLLSRIRRLSSRRFRACVVVFGLSLFGRLALLSIEPFPEPAVHDEFSYLLGGDTIAHGRLANPTPPAWHHFEPFHALMKPTYASMYPPAFALFLGAGEIVFRTPRAGLLICMALAAASLCWMLQAWLPPEWAFIGGLIAVVRISWFSYLGNTYWGGSAGILGGCLLLGASGRLMRNHRPRPQDAIAMAGALVLLANSRPYEGFAIALPVCIWTLWRLFANRQINRFLVAPALAVLALGAIGTGYYCYRVTGRITFPQSLQRAQWAIAPTLLFQKPNFKHQYQFLDQDGLYKQYEVETYLREASVPDYIRSTPERFFREWLFFISPALTLVALTGLVLTLTLKRYRLLVWAFCSLSVALALETWNQPHYVAVGTGMIYVIMLNGMRWLRCRARPRGSRLSLLGPKLLRGTFLGLILAVCLRLIVIPVNEWPPSWSSRNREIPGFRAAHDLLDKRPGRQLVIVRYGPGHFWGDSWINNGADLSSQKVIWVRDTEPTESNAPVICAFPGREILLFEPPTKGYVPPPDTTAKPQYDVSGFFEPYLVAPSSCDSQSHRP